MEQPADDAAHEQDRDEHRRQRERHGDDGEADLPGASNGRLEPPLPRFHVAHDVLEHDDGVVDDEADAEREGHQREVVDGVAREVHDGERAHDGHGQRQARDHGRRHVAQEEEDHEDDEGDGQQQGELHVVDRVADGHGAVVEDVQVDRRR